jgi:ribosomal-protein-alanine N-acetyltransferase
MIRATSGHANCLAKVHRQCFAARDAWSSEVFATQMSLPGVFGLIAEKQGFVLARVAADEAEILTICVAPAQRRLGIGRKLLQGAEHLASDWGAVSLFLEVSSHNHAAFDLYRSRGYERVGVRKRYYADGSDGVILRKSI